MMPEKIWTFWSSRYERLWAQRFSLGPARAMVIAHLEKTVPQPSRLLDIGCGVGQLAGELAERRPACGIVAADTCAAMIESAIRRHARPNVEYCNASLGRIRDKGPFDAIVSTHAFPYFPDKPSALRCIYAMLRPGGRVVMVHATMENLYDMLFLVFVRMTVSRGRYFSAGRLSSMMRRAGLVPGGIEPMKRAAFIPSIYMIEGVRPENAAADDTPLETTGISEY